MSVPFSQKLFGVVPLYSVMIVAGMVTAYFLLAAECKRRALPSDTAVDCTLVTIPCGVIGARLYYVLFSWPQYAQNPLHIFAIWEGGLAIYGGIIGGILGLILYAKKKKLPFFTLTDAILPCVLIAQAIGRWGNYFNQEAYGPLIVNPALQFFPLGVQIASGSSLEWHMATFFYESMWNAAGFGFLWSMRKRVTAPCDMTCWYFLVYGSGRFMIEQLRSDSLYLGSLRASQWLSLLLCLAACVLLLRKKNLRKALLPWLCGVLWLGRFLSIDSLPLLIAACALLLLLCRGHRRLLLGAAGLTVLSLGFWLFHRLGLPVSEGFSHCLLMAFASFSLPSCTALLYFAKSKEEALPCQTEP